jgi:ankyrin repeat protein
MGYYMNSKNAQKETALHVAVRCNHAHLIHVLIDQGIGKNVYAQLEDQKMDPFILAIALGRQTCLDELAHYLDNSCFSQKQGDVSFVNSS